METLTQGVFYLVQVVAHGLANLKERQGSIACEFIDGAKRKTAVGGSLLACFLFSGRAWCCIIAHDDAHKSHELRGINAQEFGRIAQFFGAAVLTSWDAPLCLELFSRASGEQFGPPFFSDRQPWGLPQKVA